MEKEMTEGYKIIETDNFGDDYPDEKEVVLPWMTKEEAEQIAAVINTVHCNYPGARRYWKVVLRSYQLSPGFEP
jgi:hypothetical protein